MPLTKDGDNIAVQGGLDSSTSAPKSVNTLHVGSINAYAIALVDGSGNQITSFSGGVTAIPIFGQKKITTSAVQLGSNTLVNGVIFTAFSTNAGNIFIGGSGVTTTADGTGNGYILEPGSSISFAVANTNLFYVIGTTNDVLSFACS